MEILKSNFSYDILTKIVVAGAVNVGKTFFMKRIQFYSEGEVFNIRNIDKSYISTIGREFTLFNFKIKDKTFKVQIWDVSGQERWEDTVYYLSRGAGAILLLYVDRKSFLKAIEFYTNLYKSYPKSIYALIKGKYDLPFKAENNNDIVCDEEALEFANKNDIIFTHLSSFEKYETGIIELFEIISLKYLESSQI